MYMIALYTLNYYEDKFFISFFFAHFKHTVKYVVTPRMLKLLKKI